MGEGIFTGGNRDNREEPDISLFPLLPLLSPVEIRVPSVSFSPICFGKYQPANTIGHLQFAEVDEQADRHIEQFHVA